MDENKDTALEEHERLLSMEKHLELAEIEIRNAIQAALEADMDLTIIHLISKAGLPIKEVQHHIYWRTVEEDPEVQS